jgi:hypothetical protein
LLCKKIIVAKSKKVKTGCNLAESSKEGYGSKRAVLAMVMVIRIEPQLPKSLCSCEDIPGSTCTVVKRKQMPSEKAGR